MALAWCIANKDVTTTLLGFSRVSQVDENLKALELFKKWTPEIEDKVNEILNNTPASEMEFRGWKPMPSRRETNIKGL